MDCGAWPFLVGGVICFFIMESKGSGARLGYVIVWLSIFVLWVYLVVDYFYASLVILIRLRGFMG